MENSMESRQKIRNKTAISSPAHLGHGAASHGLLCKWAPWPSAPVPSIHDHVPRPTKGHHRGFHKPTSKSMAASPVSSLHVATQDYYRRRLCSTSSNSSCGSAGYTGDAILHHPGLPKADAGHGWVSFSFGNSTVPFMATVLESPEHSQSLQASRSMINCDLAREATRKQPGGQRSKANAGPLA